MAKILTDACASLFQCSSQCLLAMSAVYWACPPTFKLKNFAVVGNLKMNLRERMGTRWGQARLKTKKRPSFIANRLNFLVPRDRID